MSFKAKSYRSSYRTNIRPKLPSDAIKNLDNFQKNVNLNSVEMLNSEEMLSSEVMLSSEEKLDEGTNLARENQINNEFDNFFDTSKNFPSKMMTTLYGKTSLSKFQQLTIKISMITKKLIQSSFF